MSPLIARSLASALTALLLALSACGGGSGVDTAPPGARPLDDPTVYSSQRTASLPGATEAAAVTQHTMPLNGTTLAYTATAGHLIARHKDTQAAQASVFYVAYTVAGEPRSRPVTFFYNGGPGSASVWLQLGSFGPKRLVTGVPETTAARPFPLVDNADTLLDTSDLVYVNAVGSGRSQAIAPYRNIDFWGVDADAELFRDFIVRWLVVNGREASPKFLYGESYGGPRSAVLVRRLQEAGVMIDGVVLQSPALDYHNNCGVDAGSDISCAGYLPSYAAVGAYHRLSDPIPMDLDGWLADARGFTHDSFAPAVDAYLASGTAAPALWPTLQDLTGLPASQWQVHFNLGPTAYREQLLPGQLIGRYDGRMRAPVGSALAAGGDPSSAWVGSSFQTAINTHLRDDLGYRNGSTYVMLSDAIFHWDFSHDGRALPDTVPDLAAALANDPALRVLSVSGVHDLATPFHVTEQDLARLASDRVQVRNYPGGHMSFLDDTTRPRQKADVVAFLGATLTTARADRRHALATDPRLEAERRRPTADSAGVPQQPGSVAPTAEAAFQAPMRDPWVPSAGERAARTPALPR